MSHTSASKESDQELQRPVEEGGWAFFGRTILMATYLGVTHSASMEVD